MFIVRAAATVLASLILVLTGVGAAQAVGNPSPTGTGQPSQECGEDNALMTPGHASSAHGSPFNEEGVAGSHYAGEQDQNNNNPHSVSQYDVACLNVSR